jgi:hypothetical protein
MAGTLSLALDSNNNPHISYVAHGWICYTFKESKNWYAENVIEGYSPAVSLTLDQGGTPHIFFRELVTGNDYLVKHAFKNEGNWTVETVDAYKAEGFDGFETFSLAIDNDGSLHISYPSQNGLKYAVKRNDAWATEIVDSNNWGAYDSLVLDSTGNPHISYMGCDSTPKDPTYYISLYHAVKQNAVWNIEAVASAGTTAGKFLDTSLTLDPNGKPHISYYVYEDEDLKYYSGIPLSTDLLTNFARELAPASYAFLIGGATILITGIVITIRRRSKITATE